MTKVKSKNTIKVIRGNKNKMPKGLQHKGIIRKNKMLYAAVNLFLENGYEKTTTASIAKAAGMAPSSFFAAFENKEALLLTLVKTMFGSQFDNTENLLGENADPLLIYGAETALQMYIAELSEPLRELYVVGYSLPTTSEYIYISTAKKLRYIFSKYVGTEELKVFYEMDIASAGITRGFMAKKCDMYFTMEDKLRRFLKCCFTLYKVPEEKQEEIIGQVLKMNLKPIAEKIIADTVRKAEEGFESVLNEA